MAKKERQEAVNVCEHGDHPAPAGKRFCSEKCDACEQAGVESEDGCAGLCRLTAEGLARLLEIALFLFDRLDDVDTAGDIAKSDDAMFRKLALKAAASRFEVAATGGYSVVLLPMGKECECGVCESCRKGAHPRAGKRGDEC